ncbi:DUF4910 domain-containing protein [Pseudemcibacter aquimaris]|uniref:DUF4910 domain-containing protein n=1 Tax=Pseudemcibacter aquimaris TaxID=2857064 RepID=UPI00201348E2|nr:DUF4910 domain-containing protein [Pseudemcibacter aquimaris]MCC3860056.1 DUF4910 domain-containing protein [Pseudemcibacter aquimaris]WDU57386.1 DUF4910 domain-containing protein [Pseudemcibacter aquimaris]
MGKNQEEFDLLNKSFDDLFPIMRSITGPGIEKSFEILGKHMPLEIEKCKTGTSVFDWTVPPEWHFERARLWGPDGKLICDTDDLNLHVVNYSEPIEVTLPLSELQNHLHSLPDLPDAVPYVTSYYNRTWGFCLSEKQRSALKDGDYKVEIKSEFVDGGVPFAQSLLKGETDREILFTSYLCHPSLANNELSGPLALLALYNRIKSWKNRKYTYRFLLNPETIGSICFLSRYHEHLKDNLEAGLILTCVGGPKEKIRIKSSRDGNSIFDQIFNYKSFTQPEKWQVTPFSPIHGSDERQFCAPGLNLPMGQVSRTVYGEYDGYHNSLDTKEFMTIESVISSVDQIEEMLIMMEKAEYPINQAPYGEPQLGKRDLYPSINSQHTWTASSDERFDGRVILNRILTLLNYADGKNSLYEIARKCECTLDDLKPVVDRLSEEGLIKFKPE